MIYAGIFGHGRNWIERAREEGNESANVMRTALFNPKINIYIYIAV